MATGNINTYGLPQVKRILHDTGFANDAEYLEYLKQAVPEVDGSLKVGMSVSVSGGTYTLSPAPSDEATSGLWNVLARCTVWLRETNEYTKFLKEMEGASVISDEVTRVSRAATIRAMERQLERTERAYMSALCSYAMSAPTTAPSIEEIGVWDTEITENDE